MLNCMPRFMKMPACYFELKGVNKRVFSSSLCLAAGSADRAVPDTQHRETRPAERLAECLICQQRLPE
ncbi:hypothetical protein NDU88_004039 [Pleurodeles waltl]|uniref:Uncharacterized protein n=1 Tax=Pleurodeles waltl TaxID=8319 RepID=A0AAV7UF01_PLEWA|nr:hypothetical protein NDU88_004039 [Pleurodeles waltl]